MTLEIIEPFRKEIKHFENFQEFTKYYELHKSDIDDMNTYRLNKSFVIPGYRFTKKDGIMKLKKDYVKPAHEEHAYAKINLIESRLIKLEDEYLKLVAFINSKLM